MRRVRRVAATAADRARSRGAADCARSRGRSRDDRGPGPRRPALQRAHRPGEAPPEPFRRAARHKPGCIVRPRNYTSARSDDRAHRSPQRIVTRWAGDPARRRCRRSTPATALLDTGVIVTSAWNVWPAAARTLPLTFRLATREEARRESSLIDLRLVVPGMHRRRA